MQICHKILAQCFLPLKRLTRAVEQLMPFQLIFYPVYFSKLTLRMIIEIHFSFLIADMLVFLFNKIYIL